MCSYNVYRPSIHFQHSYEIKSLIHEFKFTTVPDYVSWYNLVSLYTSNICWRHKACATWTSMSWQRDKSFSWYFLSTVSIWVSQSTTYTWFEKEGRYSWFHKEKRKFFLLYINNNETGPQWFGQVRRKDY